MYVCTYARTHACMCVLTFHLRASAVLHRHIVAKLDGARQLHEIGGGESARETDLCFPLLFGDVYLDALCFRTHQSKTGCAGVQGAG